LLLWVLLWVLDPVLDQRSGQGSGRVQCCPQWPVSGWWSTLVRRAVLRQGLW